MILQKAAPTQILLGRDLLFPLERRMRLGHKECRRHMDTQATLFIGSVFLPGLDDFIDQLR